MPESMWTEYESWAEGRDITNRQLLKALCLLFALAGFGLARAGRRS